MSLAPLTLTDPEDYRSRPSIDLAPSEYPLLLELSQRERGGYWWKILTASAAVHLVLLTLATRLPSFRAVSEPLPRVIVHRIPLYIPRDVLTQKAPKKREVTKQVDLAALMNLQDQQAMRESPNASSRHFEMPKNVPDRRSVKTPVSILPDAPAVALNQGVAPPLPGASNGLTSAPPPPAPATSPFQNIGSDAPPPLHPKLAAPRATVQAATSGLSQSGNGSHVIITDDSPTKGAPPVPGAVGQPGADHAGVELKSDPEGVDMRPYLAQILNIVRANWRRVIPPGVRMGTLRGRTVVEFIINRDGSIPKLVTSEPSGLTPLDAAAVAGLSMSNPLPPLPADYKGEQVKLAFSFTYNMASQ